LVADHHYLILWGERQSVATVYLALGSNLGDRQQNITKAVSLLAPEVAAKRLSSFYQTQPEGFREQPLFLNAVLKGRTVLSPQELLSRTQKVEVALGRHSSFRNAPRPIDIDILLYGDRMIDSPYLEIPHPGMSERAFVLVPLAEVAPHIRHPCTGLTVIEILSCLQRSGENGVEPWPTD
jgi:2-amino-4-hydroxy-6-hydroxymethyldihydropteridine diphosphokinase